MTPDAETPPRWSWLDRWLEPPWRARLTWLALAAMMGEALDQGLESALETFVYFLVRKLNPAIPSVAGLDDLFVFGNLVFLMVWYQPVILRLGLVRSIVWVGAATVLGKAVEYLYSFDQDSMFGVVIWSWPPVAGLLLIGRRSRPWLSLPAGALTFCVIYWYWQTIGFHYFDGGFRPTVMPYFHDLSMGANNWWLFPAMSLPYAAVILCGTRLLPRRPS